LRRASVRPGRSARLGCSGRRQWCLAPSAPRPEALAQSAARSRQGSPPQPPACGVPAPPRATPQESPGGPGLRAEVQGRVARYAAIDNLHHLPRARIDQHRVIVPAEIAIAPEVRTRRAAHRSSPLPNAVSLGTSASDQEFMGRNLLWFSYRMQTSLVRINAHARSHFPDESAPSWGWRHATFLKCVLALGAAASISASALGKEPNRRVAPKLKPAATKQDVTSTSSVRATGREACFQSRRKLWVESDGWKVRRVTTCEPSMRGGN
jgi:hypothetical protein